MNNYIEVSILFTPCDEIFTDVAASVLGEIGYESFTASETGMIAYITENQFNEQELQESLAALPFDIQSSYSFETIVSQNWNEEWEKNYFQPIVIDDECVIHSTFHKDTPKVKYDILIDPKMAFGTGHHETTSLMLAQLLQSDVAGKSVLDMGCGTAVLAILAHMKGAGPIVAIDIDEWAINNSHENIALNHTNGIELRLGGAETLKKEYFDLILANINRNILLNDIHHYSACLQSGGVLLMSGFYTDDIDAIKAEAEKHGLSFVLYTEKNRWVSVKFIKQ